MIFLSMFEFYLHNLLKACESYKITLSCKKKSEKAFEIEKQEEKFFKKKGSPTPPPPRGVFTRT